MSAAPGAIGVPDVDAGGGKGYADGDDAEALTKFVTEDFIRQE